MKKFDASIPRKMFWSDKVPNKNRCPLCHSRLENEYHTYLFATRNRGDFESYIFGNDFGLFCPQCPVVVLDREGFGETILQISGTVESRGSGKVEFAVMGIVDMNAIPKEKGDIPLGDDDNPIPVVEFVSTIEGINRGKDIQRKGKRLSGNQRRRRNRA